MRKVAFILIISFCNCFTSSAQPKTSREINILFYNVENLFDTKDDPLTNDDEFLPDGERHWSFSRLRTKLNHLCKLIVSSAGFELPEIIGLCEVENREVLEMLLETTPLKNYSYSIIHKNSPDDRGIDVALLFRKDFVKPLAYRYIPVLDEHGEVRATREILHAEFLIPNEDTIHLFFNHWPSRYGGQAASEKNRFQAARALRNAVMGVRTDSPSAKIIIMGDFNDQPNNKSLTDVLLAVASDHLLEEGELVNLSYSWKPGTIKYRQTWSVFDQIIVSDHLLVADGWHTRVENAQIVNLPFLFEDDLKFKGKKLNRTYVGFKYHGGFSDHLPILLKLEMTIE